MSIAAGEAELFGLHGSEVIQLFHQLDNAPFPDLFRIARAQRNRYVANNPGHGDGYDLAYQRLVDVWSGLRGPEGDRDLRLHHDLTEAAWCARSIADRLVRARVRGLAARHPATWFWLRMTGVDSDVGVLAAATVLRDDLPDELYAALAQPLHATVSGPVR